MNINLLYICHIYIFDLSYIIFDMKIDNKLYIYKRKHFLFHVFLLLLFLKKTCSLY